MQNSIWPKPMNEFYCVTSSTLLDILDPPIFPWRHTQYAVALHLYALSQFLIIKCDIIRAFDKTMNVSHAHIYTR